VSAASRTSALDAPNALLAGAVAAAINHVLDQNAWARDALSRHSGRNFGIAAFPLDLTFSLGPDGHLAAGTPADREATIRLTPPAALRYLAGDPDAWRLAEIDGDAAFANVVADVLANLAWDVEEDLSKLVGDVAAHRIGDLLRGIAAWRRHAAASLARQANEYLVEEAAFFPHRRDVAEFVRGVDEVRDAIARLEKRLSILENPGRASAAP
jgi:ubiquinone biosynthesis protein UbiJ